MIMMDYMELKMRIIVNAKMRIVRQLENLGSFQTGLVEVYLD